MVKEVSGKFKETDAKFSAETLRSQANLNMLSKDLSDFRSDRLTYISKAHNHTYKHVEKYAVNTKSNVTMSLDPKLANIAKELRLNISKTCENALKFSISRLQG